MTSTPFSCGVCFESPREAVVTKCGHVFCWPCLQRWLRLGNESCPTCKGGLHENRKGDIIPVFGGTAVPDGGAGGGHVESSSNRAGASAGAAAHHPHAGGGEEPPHRGGGAGGGGGIGGHAGAHAAGAHRPEEAAAAPVPEPDAPRPQANREPEPRPRPQNMFQGGFAPGGLGLFMFMPMLGFDFFSVMLLVVQFLPIDSMLVSLFGMAPERAQRIAGFVRWACRLATVLYFLNYLFDLQSALDISDAHVTGPSRPWGSGRLPGRRMSSLPGNTVVE